MKESYSCSKYADDHIRRRNQARLHGKGCNCHCPCRWCKENRIFKYKRQEPIDCENYK